MAKRTKKERQPFHIEVVKGQTNAAAVAAKLAGPVNRHGYLTSQFNKAMVADLPIEDQPTLVEYSHELRRRMEAARDGNRDEASDLLVTQALTLDGIFTETARRAAANMEAGYLPAFETYMRLALKAQAQSRATIEALAKLHQPREQTVRHVHVNEGGQAIVAGEFHSHTGGAGNGRSTEQSHGPGSPPKGCPALSGPEPAGPSVPVSSARRPKPVPNARGKSGSAAR